LQAALRKKPSFKEENLMDLIDQNFRNQLENNKKRMNPLIKYFKNTLIATVFENLICYTVQKLFGINLI